MFSSTALDINNYYPEDSSWDFLADFIANVLMQPDLSIDVINKMIDANVEGLEAMGVKETLVAVETPFVEVYGLQTMDYSQLRITEIGLADAVINVQEILGLRKGLTLDPAYLNSTSNTTTMNSINIIVSY